MSSDGDDYVKVAGKAQCLRPASVLFAVGDSVPRAAWVPRSCIHGADDLTLKAKAGEINATFNSAVPMTLRIRRWKAEELGFDGTRDDKTEDLFGSGRPIL